MYSEIELLEVLISKGLGINSEISNVSSLKEIVIEKLSVSFFEYSSYSQSIAAMKLCVPD